MALAMPTHPEDEIHAASPPSQGYGGQVGYERPCPEAGGACLAMATRMIRRSVAVHHAFIFRH